MQSICHLSHPFFDESLKFRKRCSNSKECTRSLEQESKKDGFSSRKAALKWVALAAMLSVGEDIADVGYSHKESGVEVAPKVNVAVMLDSQVKKPVQVHIGKSKVVINPEEVLIAST